MATTLRSSPPAPETEAAAAAATAAVVTAAAVPAAAAVTAAAAAAPFADHLADPVDVVLVSTLEGIKLAFSMDDPLGFTAMSLVSRESETQGQPP